jgi:hypothetical protein
MNYYIFLNSKVCPINNSSTKGVISSYNIMEAKIQGSLELHIQGVEKR